MLIAIAQYISHDSTCILFRVERKRIQELKEKKGEELA